MLKKKKANLVGSYSFGRMVVGGEEYTEDLIVFPDKIKPGWWLKQRHLVSLEDLKEVFGFEPEVLVIGTGDSGLMKIADEVFEEMKKKKIGVICKNTHEAYRIFNQMLKQGKKVVGAFHLTC